VPATALRAGRNVVAARVTDGGGGGGLIGPASDIYVDVGGSRRPLPGSWKFKVGVVSLGDDGQHINKIPTVLYNRMVHPLLDFPIKGVIWYQGESNANNVEQAAEYRGQFRTMIERWRAEWRGNGGASFPFLWVQLPNWGPRDTVPPRDAAWATLRESQDSALALPNTGQVVAIDIGDWDDLHPRNKQDVGARLALAARAVAYGQRLDASGPRYRSHEVAGGRVTIRLDHASGLTTRMPGDSVAGFAIAGEDGRFVWARARIEGDGVVVWSDAIAAPVAVRYAWGNSPAKANVVNRAGLPMAPFRTDAW
jgi:sialate O-acetylesterase